MTAASATNIIRTPQEWARILGGNVMANGITVRFPRPDAKRPRTDRSCTLTVGSQFPDGFSVADGQNLIHWQDLKDYCFEQAGDPSSFTDRRTQQGHRPAGGRHRPGSGAAAFGSRGEEGRDSPPAFTPPPIWDLDQLLTEGPPPEPSWLVLGLVPADNVTLISGDGGLGKSNLIMQLAHCVRGGGFWMGRQCKKGAVIYVSAEETRREMHYRFARIAKRIVLTGKDPDFQIKLVGLAEEEDTDVAMIEDGRVVGTPLMDWIEKQVAEIEAVLLVLDAAADVHGNINEILRRDVRGFIALLRRRFAHKHGCAVVLIAHPSVDGLKTGRGTSGSTHWRNSVRAVGLLEENGEDDETRIFRWPKINNGPRNLAFVLRWSDGVFAIDDPNSAAAREVKTRHMTIFRDLFKRCNEDNRTLSDSKNAANYAPKVMMEMAKAEGMKEVKLNELEEAMQGLLFGTKELRVVTENRARKMVWAASKTGG
jgi:hypothetical protein